MATNTGTKTDYPFAKLRDMLRPGYGEGDQGIIHHKHVVGGLHVFPSVEKMHQMHASVREAGVLCYVVNVEADQIIINETYTLSDDLLTFIPCSFGKEGPEGKEGPPGRQGEPGPLHQGPEIADFAHRQHTGGEAAGHGRFGFGIVLLFLLISKLHNIIYVVFIFG